MVPFLTTASTVMCPHLGQAVLMSTNALASILGAPALLLTDVHLIAGCTATPPCMLITWSAGATQTKVNGIPVLLQTSIGICYNASLIPQGTAVVAQSQCSGSGV